MLEFGVPRGVWRPAWELYVRVGLPLAGRALSRGWGDVGSFLGPSIRDFWERWPEQRLLDAWREAGDASPGAPPAEPRRRRRRLGDPRMTSAPEPRPAWYALHTGGWRDYVTLLHLPYTAWHLAYVVIGGCLAPDGGLGAARAHRARVLPRHGHRRARTRRAARTTAPHDRSRPACSWLSRWSRSPPPARSGSRSRSPSTRCSSRSSRRASSSFRPTTSSSSAASSTPICGSHSPGVRFRCSRATRRARARSRQPPCSRRRGQPPSRSPSDDSRPRYGRCGARCARWYGELELADGTRRPLGRGRAHRRTGIGAPSAARPSTILAAAALAVVRL